jgi:hypothetical protein
MRLWSIHPKMLDRAGLGAVWREGLLCRAVLNNQTRGYRAHPQLQRFKSNTNPLQLIDAYLHTVCDEAENRGYKYDRSKLVHGTLSKQLTVTEGQLVYEFQHLQRKLELRAKPHLGVTIVPVHPLFDVVSGDIESWERV